MVLAVADVGAGVLTVHVGSVGEGGSTEATGGVVGGLDVKGGRQVVVGVWDGEASKSDGDTVVSV